MEGQGSKKRALSEIKGAKGSKRFNQEIKQVDDSSSDSSSLSNSPVSSSSDLVDEISSSSSSDHDDEKREDKDLPWMVPINSETKELCFMPVDPEGENHMEELDEYSRLQKLDNLKCIDIDLTHIMEDSTYNNENGKVSEILNRIFLASVDSVEEIILRNPIGYLPGVVFPVMGKVVKLQLLFYWWGSDSTNFTGYLRGGKVFPKGFKLKTMPKLEEVIIKLETEGQSPQYHLPFDCWKNNLKSVGTSKTVKKIQYSDDCGFSKKQLKTSFPKATLKK